MAEDGSRGGTPLPGERQVLHEHAECLAAVARVESCLDRPPADPAGWLADLGSRLVELKAVLAPHFADEAEGYLYDELPERFPVHASKLEQLRGEHERILRDLKEVILRATSAGSVELHHVREINARAQLLVARIRRHEAEENEIIMRSLWEDIGAAD